MYRWHIKVISPTLINLDFNTEEYAKEETPSKTSEAGATLPNSEANQEQSTVSSVLPDSPPAQRPFFLIFPLPLFPPNTTWKWKHTWVFFFLFTKIVWLNENYKASFNFLRQTPRTYKPTQNTQVLYLLLSSWGFQFKAFVNSGETEDNEKEKRREEGTKEEKRGVVAVFDKQEPLYLCMGPPTFKYT